MKKMMIALVIMASAAFANAGTVTWGMSGLLGVGTITGNHAAYSDVALSGAVAYLFEGTGPSATTLAAIESGKWNVAESGYIATKTTNTSGVIKVTGIGDYTSETVSLYAIVFDAATVADARWYEVTTPISQDFGASGNKTFTFAQATQVAGGSGWTAIPEPTSGLLLLVGGALLALKRRRA